MAASDGPVRDFDGWYADEFPRVRAALTLAVRDAGLAEEATAEAFARALVHWRKVSATRSPAAWVYTVALNQVRSTVRRRRLERRWVQRQRVEHAAAPPDPDDELWRAVARLAPRARTAVALRYVADLTEAEVARAMGVTRGTVAATLHHARRQLAELLAASAPPATTPGGMRDDDG